MSVKTFSRAFVLSLGICSTMFAWQADRLSIDGRWTNYWIITCNDGYMHGGNYGPDGPSFYEAGKLCENHAGISVKPTVGGPVIYQVNTGQPATFDLLLGDLVDSGAVNPTGATKLTDSREPAVWAKTKVGLAPLPSGAPADAVTVAATRIDLPEPRGLPNWVIAAAAACAVALVIMLLKRKKA